MRQPEQMDFLATPLMKKWKEWREEVELYFRLVLDKETEVKRKDAIRWLVGVQGRKNL